VRTPCLIDTSDGSVSLIDPPIGKPFSKEPDKDSFAFVYPTVDGSHET
jgi:hypothetical protein